MLATNDYGPIADLYDTYVPVTFDIPFFLEETRKAQGEVLELMSGTGRVSVPLLEAGVRLTCVDLSPELNAVLCDKLVKRRLIGRVFQMDVRKLDLGKQFAMVIIPFHSFAHLTSPEDQCEALKRIHAHLIPGGTFICTLGNPVLRGQAVDGQLRLYRKYPLENRQGTLLFWIVEKTDPTDPQIVETTEFFEEYDTQGILTGKRMIEVRFRLTSRAEFEALAVAAGFTIEALYGDYLYGEFREGSSPYMIWVLMKR